MKISWYPASKLRPHSYLCQGGYVSPLSVCLLTWLHKNYWSNTIFYGTVGHSPGTNWRAPWKNWISSTSMKLRKSLVKPVTRQNILSYWFFHPRSSCTTHTHSVLTAIFPSEPGLAGCPLNSPSPFIPGLRILLGVLHFSSLSFSLTPHIHLIILISVQFVFNSCTTHLMLFSVRSPIYASSCMTISGEKNRTTRYILSRHWLYKWFSCAANVRRYIRYMRRAWRSRMKEPNYTL